MTEHEKKRVAESFGRYLNSLRTGLGLSLREVESLTENKVSNPYLSQLEKGKIFQPSPHILNALSDAYQIDQQKLMEKAGYMVGRARSISKSRAKGSEVLRSHSIENLTAEEEKELLEYLAFWRSKRSVR
jgi:HTH-type transcriptional regulator, competence development regulator